ncbi:von Willebrand factor A domain-containing protein 3B [Discoglossus pictus]
MAGVDSLMSSTKWLHSHGLKRKKLTLQKILTQLGFQQKEDYVNNLGRPVSSRYAHGLFQQYNSNDKIYNLTARKEQVLQKIDSVTSVIKLYKQRLHWLTSGSQLVFGVIQEPSVVLVLDLGTVTKDALFRDAFCLVLREQVAQVSKFNIICVSQEPVRWQQRIVRATPHNVEEAIEWVWNLQQTPTVTPDSAAQTVSQALDEQVEAVYYFALGDILEDQKQPLLHSISHSPCPVHTVSYNAQKEETLRFLKELSDQTKGRTKLGQNSEKNVKMNTFHAPIAPERLNLHDTENNNHPVSEVKDEDFVSSKVWLKHNGLRAQKLRLYEAFADCAFRHSDGVVDIKTKPEDESVQTDADNNMKLINAKYCDRFVHAHWKDGSVVHVYISKEKYRWYEEKMKTALEQMERRVKWLQQGSRELFGTVLEDRVYILIDTSHSMKDKLFLVKEKIFQLMQEQLRYKKMFNFVNFDSRVEAWKAKLAEVNEENLKDAWAWVQELKVGSSTNTLRALQVSLADSKTEAIYLLTDGRPDQPAKTILTQVNYEKPVPIHTISFNCNDKEANRFLYELSSDTGGRFHSYNTYLQDPDAPQPFVSEDIQLILNEIEKGKANLEKIQKVHTECLMLDLYHNGDNDLAQRLTQTQMKKPLPKSDSTHELTTYSPLLHRKSMSAPRLLQRKKALHAEQTKTSLLRTLSRGVQLCENNIETTMPPETKELFMSNSMKAEAVLKGFNIMNGNDSEKKVKKTPKECLDMSSLRWLKTHGLVAKRLTIMDALAPTTVPHTAKYVPIIDKHVVSKVFDEVLPLAHVSGNRKLITLINPQAVNLDKYKQKLAQAIKSYERRLNLVVWRALSQEERDKFESDKPLSFFENKEALLQALDRMAWPISAEDVTLLEDEISAGKTYFQQATDLQATTANDASMANAKAQNNKGDIEKQVVKVKPKRKRLDPLRSQKVIARSDVDGFYYQGTVIKSVSSKCALVDFCQGENQIIPISFIIQTGGALPCPPLKVGDFVFAKTGRGSSCYVPAVVIATPRTEASDKLYSVLKYNSRKEHCLRSELFKISQSQFGFSCRYIREAQMVDYTIPSVQIVKPILNQKLLEEEKKRRKEKKKGRNNSGKPFKREKNKKGNYMEHHLVTMTKSRERSSSSDSNNEEDNILTYGEVDMLSVQCPPSPILCLAPPDQKPPRSIRSALPKTSTPRSPNIEANYDTNLEINKKLESLAAQITQYQKEHTEQQQNIQEFLKDVAALKSHQEKCRSEQDQNLARQQIDLLQQLKMATPISSTEVEQDDQRKDNQFTKRSKIESRLCPLGPGQKVLAVCSHNGFYREGTIVHDCGDLTYFVQNATGEISRVSREGIFSDIDDNTKEIKEDDTVLGPHPLHDGAFCPGVVLEIMPDFKLVIQYYDHTENVVLREQLYLTSPERYERDTANISECEERWVGQPVVARNDETGTFHLAEVRKRVGTKYVISWADGKTVTQDITWIFGKYSQPHVLSVGGHVLTLASSTSLTFLPGVITGYNGTKLQITFCNGKSCQNVEPHHCFGLSRNRFNMAVQHYHQQKTRREAQEVNSASDNEDSLSDISSVTITSIESENFSQVKD